MSMELDYNDFPTILDQYICGFYAVNGRHCFINGHCVSCRGKEGETV